MALLVAHAYKMKPLHLVWTCVHHSQSGKSIDHRANVRVTVALTLAVAATLDELLQVHSLTVMPKKGQKTVAISQL